MPKSTPITVKVAGLPEVESALAELAALKAAIRWHRADAAQVLEDISDGTVQADDEGRTRARIEADVWDEVADAMDTIIEELRTRP